MSNEDDEEKYASIANESLVLDKNITVQAFLEDSEQETEGKSIVNTPTAGPGPPPDGGFTAWLMVLAGFFTMFNSWGTVNSFGAFQDYYQVSYLENESPSTISWIGSVEGFFVIAATIFTGRFVDAGYVNYVMAAGTFFLTFGMMMTSLATEFYQIFLAQGVCVGLGCSCLFVSGVGTVAPYFSSKRAFAIGLMASGSSLGGVLYPIMTQRLITQIGYPWTTRVLGFIILATSLIPTVVLKSRLPPRKPGPFIDISPLKETAFLILNLGFFFGFMGMYIPIFYIEPFAELVGMKPSLVIYMVSILSSSSILGRIVPNFLADKIGPYNVLLPCTFIAGILAICWVAVKDEAGTIVFALLYGCFSGSFVSVPPAVISSITKDMSKIGARLSLCFFISGFAVLAGTPIAGALISREKGGFLGAQLFAGVCILLGAVFIAWSRHIAGGNKGLLVKL